MRKKGAQPLGASDRATVPEKVSERAMLRCALVQYHTLKPLIGKSMQESRSNLRLAGGKHIARILSVVIITSFSLIALSLHVKHGDLPSYTSILVNAKMLRSGCELVLRQYRSYSCLVGFFLLLLRQLLLLDSACCFWVLPAAVLPVLVSSGFNLDMLSQSASYHSDLTSG